MTSTTAEREPVEATTAETAPTPASSFDVWAADSLSCADIELAVHSIISPDLSLLEDRGDLYLARCEFDEYGPFTTVSQVSVYLTPDRTVATEGPRLLDNCVEVTRPPYNGECVHEDVTAQLGRPAFWLHAKMPEGTETWVSSALWEDSPEGLLQVSVGRLNGDPDVVRAQALTLRASL